MFAKMSYSCQLYQKSAPVIVVRSYAQVLERTMSGYNCEITSRYSQVMPRQRAEMIESQENPCHPGPLNTTDYVDTLSCAEGTLFWHACRPETFHAELIV